MSFPLPKKPPTLRERAIITKICETNYEERMRVLARCAEDTPWFINFALWTFDPRPDVDQHDIPFIQYEFQVDYIREMDAALTGLYDLLTEKSRDMGVTWLNLGWFIHKWLFRDGFQGLIGSRKEDLVDNDTMDSHFGKLEYLLRRLPAWMLPRKFRFDKHRMKLKLMNPENGNTIVGESANSEFSRQGRYTAILYDEAAFWPDLTKAWRAGGSATRVRFGVSTPNGMEAFGRMVHAKDKDGRPVYKKVRLHWTLHPRKDEAWYRRECGRMTPEDVAQELDISYSRSVRGVVYPTWINVPKGVYPFEPKWHLYVSWDFGLDETALIWWLRDPATGKIRMIDSYRNQNKRIDFVPFVTGAISADTPRDQYTSDELAKIAVHSQWGPAVHFGDPSGNQRNIQTGISLLDVLKTHHIHVITNARANDFKSRKTFTELGFDHLEVNVNPGAPIDCSEVDDAMTQARYPERSPDSQSTNEVSRPIHDWTSHFRSSVEYFFVNAPQQRRGTRRPEATTTRMAYDNM